MNEKDIQVFTARLPYETWCLLRMMATKKRETMSNIVTDLIEKNRKKFGLDVDIK